MDMITPAEASAHEEGQSFEIDVERIQLMQIKISTAPQSLVDSNGKRYPFIHRLPPRFPDSETSSYIPHTVSIGPLHRGKDQYRYIEQFKWSYLHALMDRKKLSLEDLIKKIMPLEHRARKSYTEEVDQLDSFEFVEMLILDGCFIIELFRKSRQILSFEHDQITSVSNIYQSILEDLIKLENQIPWIILEELFSITRSSITLEETIVSAFRDTFREYNMKSNLNIMNNYSMSTNRFGGEPFQPFRHLLHMLHTLFTSLWPEIPDIEFKTRYAHLSKMIQPRVIPSISDLQKAGITAKTGDTKFFLKADFKHGTLLMTPLILNNLMICLLFNSMAFEQCQDPTKTQFSTYITLLNCLMTNDNDVKYLIDQKIIQVQNFSGTENDVIKIFRNMGKGLTLEPKTSYLSELFYNINLYHGKKWNVQMAKLSNTYFDSPWSAISLLAASVLLVLTFIQTFYTIIAYNNPPRS
ncbi:UPF0481 protein At3g47200-like [Impatiens glandulifera]|uniref:UPF0481 protein At3g47200-like n=1 Tax=Impatiens glandulifera TaxID=253017 RepID=UPI001FB14956|nr:UPF0481 protein At3g47200-like [Impatiens glandulifera]